MSGRARVTLADGRRVTGYRKTLSIRRRRAPGDMPPFRVVVLLPEKWLVTPGETRVAGVSVEPDPISGPLAVIEHRDLEWACRQLGRFLLKVANDERILSATVLRDGVQQVQQIVVNPECVEFPRGTKATWRVPA